MGVRRRSPAKSYERRRAGGASKGSRRRPTRAQEVHAESLPASADTFRCVQQVNRDNNNIVNMGVSSPEDQRFAKLWDDAVQKYLGITGKDLRDGDEVA